MSTRVHSPVRIFVIALVVALVLAVAGSSYAQPAVDRIRDRQLSVASVEALGIVTFPTGYEFAGTEVGGLSGIAFDARRDVYYAISDDGAAPRFYTMAIDVSDGSLDDGDVTFLDVTLLKQRGNVPYPPGTVDAESIVQRRSGPLYISSEGEIAASPPSNPFVNQYNLTGSLTGILPLPEKFLPGGANSVRDNLSFEGLAATPNGEWLYTATENALEADGPVATLTESSPSRVLEYELDSGRPGREFVYVVSPIPKAPEPPDEFADNGLSELLALDNRGTFVVMERSFAVGVGNTIRLFETSIQGATDVSGMEVLGPPGSYEPMSKELIADFEEDLGISPDNLEAMRFGPTLPDGRRLMIVLSDNNFNPSQITQVIAVAVELELVNGD